MPHTPTPVSTSAPAHQSRRAALSPVRRSNSLKSMSRASRHLWSTRMGRAPPREIRVRGSKPGHVGPSDDDPKIQARTAVARIIMKRRRLSTCRHPDYHRGDYSVIAERNGADGVSVVPIISNVTVVNTSTSATAVDSNGPQSEGSAATGHGVSNTVQSRPTWPMHRDCRDALDVAPVGAARGSVDRRSLAWPPVDERRCPR